MTEHATGQSGTADGSSVAPSVHAARVLLQALAALGVEHVVLSPGSRSAPLAYAAVEAAAGQDAHRHAPRMRLHVRIDERSAGFLAVGLSRAVRAEGGDGVVAVITTSGTAVANLHPAVLEAHHSHLPLLLLTADRPHELRGTGANQTTDQVGLLAPVRLVLDVPAPTSRPGEDRDWRHLASRAVAAAMGVRSKDPGPVHLNLAFREPLVPSDDQWPEPSQEGLVRVAPRTAPAALASGGELLREPMRTVVVAGDGAGAIARWVAEANTWPLLAEPSSGARGGPNAIAAYRLLLASPALGGAVQRVVVMGRPTLSRPVQSLLGRRDVESIVIAPFGDAWPDPTRNATSVLDVVPRDILEPTGPPDTTWLAAWRRAGGSAAAAIAEVLATQGVLTGPTVAAEIATSTGTGDVLVVGSSNPIRDLDLVAAWDDPPLVLANRGLSGIDGTVSTAVGAALGLGRPVRAYIGDLTFLHDVGGLLIGPREERPDLRVVVANDDGGSIFTTLEHGAHHRPDDVERVFSTRHGADLSALCAGYGIDHRLVTTREELRAALSWPVRGLSVVEVRIDRAGRRVLGQTLGEAVRRAVG
jgi:2-succinyl-5-enolpyruvyl-6-hydroxy-3-cyclohexene-1-carboxylate synthase